MGVPLDDRSAVLAQKNIGEFECILDESHFPIDRLDPHGRNPGTLFMAPVSQFREGLTRALMQARAVQAAVCRFEKAVSHLMEVPR